MAVTPLYRLLTPFSQNFPSSAVRRHMRCSGGQGRYSRHSKITRSVTGSLPTPSGTLRVTSQL